MRRIVGPLLAFALALANAPANAQVGATPATPDNRLNAPPSTAIELDEPSAQPATVDDICHALEQSAAEGGAFCLLSGVAGVAPACALAGVFATASAQASSGTAIRGILGLA